MRSLIGVLIFLLYNNSFAQPGFFMPGDYLDGHFIRERYTNHNKGVDNFLSATDQYINSHSYTELIVIQYDDTEEREPDRYAPYPVAPLYPENNLLHEDEYRTKRVWRAISLSDTINFPLKTLFLNPGDSAISLPNLIINRILSGEILCFRGDAFIEVFTLSEFKDRVYVCDTIAQTDSGEPLYNRCTLKNVEGIIIKEDWFYDKKTNLFQSKIIGMGLATMDMRSDEPFLRELFWIYYPAVKNILKTYAVNNAGNADEFFENKKFRGKVNKTEVPKNNFLFEPRISNEYENEFDALFEIQLLNEEFLFSGKDKTKNGMWEDFFSNGKTKLTGKLLKGNKKGLWKFYYPDGTKRCEINFKNNLPQGLYKSYYENGALKEEALFEKGLRTGPWKALYENGKKKSFKNYKEGYADGIQQAWYANGQALLEYSFQNKILNGPFKRWYSDGVLLEEGIIENGIMKGLWKYKIELDEHCCKIVKDGIAGKIFPLAFDSLAFDDCLFDFNLLYAHENKEGCPQNLCVNVKDSKIFLPAYLTSANAEDLKKTDDKALLINNQIEKYREQWRIQGKQKEFDENYLKTTKGFGGFNFVSGDSICKIYWTNIADCVTSSVFIINKEIIKIVYDYYDTRLVFYFDSGNLILFIDDEKNKSSCSETGNYFAKFYFRENSVFAKNISGNIKTERQMKRNGERYDYNVFTNTVSILKQANELKEQVEKK